MRKIRFKKQTKTVDKSLLALVLVLTFAGLVAVASASAPSAVRNFSDKFYFIKQQAVWAVVGIVLMILFSKISYKFWEKYATHIFFIGVLGLILVLIPGIGTKVSGARRWLVFGPVSIQPSEFIKIALVLFIAKVASNKKPLLSYILPLIVLGGFVMMQPDLGTTTIIMAIGISQIFVSGVGLIHFAGLGLAGGILGLLLIIVSDYRRERLLTFFEQSQDPLGTAYHIRQILFALGSGGLFGVGIGQSRQKYLFLPETATDSIFAVVAEEVGFMGGAIIILLFAFFIFKGLKIANKAPDIFSRVAAVGIVAWIGGQAFLNIGSMTAVVPLTGIPLPFFSYGGSAMITVLMATGILLNISKHVTEAK